MRNLQCIDLGKKFGGNTALRDVTFSFPAKGLVGIVGTNGSGKTTLLNLLTGFVRPDSGVCLFGDQEITGMAPFQIARLGIARTFQDLRLIRAMTVLETIVMSCDGQVGDQLLRAISGYRIAEQEKESRTHAMRIIESLGLEAKSTSIVGALSFGEQKLVTLACCLTRRADVLLLDEPMAGASPKLAARIKDVLVSVARNGRLVVFIEHSLPMVRETADEVVVLESGMVVAKGSPADVLGERYAAGIYFS